MSVATEAFVASRLLAQRRDDGRPLIYICLSETRAPEIARLLSGLAPDSTVALLPAWDCLPYDRASPSAEAMGKRMTSLRRWARGEAAILLATPEALVQRTPPRAAAEGEPLPLLTGGVLEPQALESRLSGLGYRPADPVHEPGEYALRGEVLDLFPADADAPCRLDTADARIAGVRRFDPLTQRSSERVDQVAIGPASEILVPDGGEPSIERLPGSEHALAAFYPELTTVFDIVADAVVLAEPGVWERGADLIRQAATAYKERASSAERDEADRAPPPSPPERLYLSRDRWEAVRRRAIELQLDGYEPVPRFATERGPAAALARFAEAQRQQGHRVVLAAGDGRDMARMSAAIKSSEEARAGPAASWADVLAAKPAALLGMALDASGGFVDVEAKVALIAAPDLLGSRAHAAADQRGPTPWAADQEFAPGDGVIHEDHGLGVLRGLETLDTEALGRREVVSIDYAKDARLLSPLEELSRIWRYGSEEADVSLDRLEGDGWAKRRQGIEADIAKTARDMVALAKERATASAPKLEPPRQAYETFVAGFPFRPTPDQDAAIAAVLADLASGRPMDRLVVGDVGFGKTEVALRAAAAAVLAGKQVAIAAPTTVLVRQHVETFRRRFAELDVPTRHLSRLVSAAEAAKTKSDLADGSARLVIGTQALAGKGVRFADLGLLIVDEEHRFGAADKARLKALGQGVHVLTLSATPIPRTLQQALVGLQDLSVIATPPARRRPIRTFVEPLEEAVIKTALSREKGRGGQSFVVVPRIEDMEPMRERLASLVPKLRTISAHGKMPAAEVDEAMVGFAEGRGDVLLATNIIESGLDVPRANTMLITDADRFGLAQLHQLRGRVGRGRAQGVCYLFTDPERPPAEATLTRLKTLAALDRLGAGMQISARDLDLRGAGELMGEAQAGHVSLIGVGLYQHLLELAIRAARGEPVEDWTPEIKIDAEGGLPEAYVPDMALRLSLYSRLARATELDAIEALSDEIEDRFGPPPPPVSQQLQIGRLRVLCRRLGVARVDAGPQALAYSFREGVGVTEALQALVAARDALSWKGERLIQARPSESGGERLQLALDLLSELA